MSIRSKIGIFILLCIKPAHGSDDQLQLTPRWEKISSDFARIGAGKLTLKRLMEGAEADTETSGKVGTLEALAGYSAVEQIMGMGSDGPIQIINSFVGPDQELFKYLVSQELFFLREIECTTHYPIPVISGDGKYIIMGPPDDEEEDSTGQPKDLDLRVLDIETWLVTKHLRGSFTRPSNMVSSVSGKYLLTCSHIDGSTKAWDIEKGEMCFNADDRLHCARYVMASLDDRKVTACFDDNITKVWDMKNDTLPEDTFESPKPTTDGDEEQMFMRNLERLDFPIFFSEDNTRLITQSGDRSILNLWNLEANKLQNQIILQKREEVFPIRTRDGTKIIIFKNNVTTKIYDLDNFSLIAEEPPFNPLDEDGIEKLFKKYHCSSYSFVPGKLTSIISRKQKCIGSEGTYVSSMSNNCNNLIVGVSIYENQDDYNAVSIKKIQNRKTVAKQKT